MPSTNEHGHDRMGSEARSFAVLMTLFTFFAVVVVGVGYHLADQPIPPAVIAAQVLLMIVLFLLARTPRTNAPVLPPCLACGRSRLVPTRIPDGPRVWTCFACGRETIRRQTYAELGSVSFGRQPV